MYRGVRRGIATIACAGDAERKRDEREVVHDVSRAVSPKLWWRRQRRRMSAMWVGFIAPRRNELGSSRCASSCPFWM